MQRNIHIIERQLFEINMVDRNNPSQVKEKLSSYCSQKLLPAIETLFDKQVKSDRIYRAGRIVIDVGRLPVENWENRLIEHVLDKLSFYLSSAVSVSGTTDSATMTEESNVMVGVKKEEEIIESVFRFLETGTLPWYSSIRNNKDLDEAFLEITREKAVLENLIRLFQKNKNVLERFVMQAGDVLMIDILKKKNIEKSTISEISVRWEPYFDIAGISPQEQQLKIYVALFLHLDEPGTLRNPESRAKYIARQFSLDQLRIISSALNHKTNIHLDDSNLNREIRKLISSKKKTENKPGSLIKEHRIAGTVEKSSEAGTQIEESWYISNSGLVLFNPFLKSLFEKLGYQEKDIWVSTEMQQHAVHLLQYLVTGEESKAEFDLVLNKILTGYQLGKPLPKNIVLDQPVKKEADVLVEAMIGHWKALKNTSIKGLRTTFLQREGKLTRKTGGWLLQVEQKTVDILLEKIPWGFSVIKTPWMQKLMHVEWV